MQYLTDETGASAAEYGLILALIAVAIIASLTTLGGKINNATNSVSSALKSTGS
jgi:pilus assembly protein Flp/PilA